MEDIKMENFIKKMELPKELFNQIEYYGKEEPKNVANFILRCKKYNPNLSDKKITKLIKIVFPDLNFSICSQVDSILYPENEYGGYWRNVYNFPKNGDIINSKFARNCGFFTFSLEKN